MEGFGWNRPRFVPAPGPEWGPHRRRSLGQTAAEWTGRAREAAAKYAGLLGRTPEISDAKAVAEIRAWVGRDDVPGTPAERYRSVSADLAAGTAWNDVTTKRVQDLEDAVREFEMRVSDAERTHGTSNPEAKPVATASPAGALTPTGFALGLTAILGLLVLPLLIE